MEVTAATYPSQLLAILTNLSEADFVSFDLEFTGIPSHLPGKDPHKPRNGGRNTLEERYLETKEAADRYQILQVGLTCGRFDYLANKYVLRPYNISLSPLLDERLDIDREICLQSGAIKFLLGNNFDMAAPFVKGVQYLSREEAARARQMAYDRFDKKTVVEDVLLNIEDKDSIDFVSRVREAITNWKRSQAGPSMLEITTHTGLPDPPLASVVSRFEKRLVHQLVRADFPDLVSIGRNECIRIIPFDQVRETDNVRRLKLRTRESIARQTGFRWVFEALAKGDISEADPVYYNASVSGSIIAFGYHDIKDRFDRAHERLKTRQPVLVGHNMFTDLIYLYRSFVGELPATLDGFCTALHEEFPRIIDTKWLATHAGGDLNFSPTLQKIAESLEDQLLPDIVTHSDHPKYHDTKAFHEAGYDSLLTATSMIRLAAKLKVECEGEKTQNAAPDDISEGSFKSVTEEPGEVVLRGREKPNQPTLLPPTGKPHEAPQYEFPTKKKTRRAKKASAGANSNKTISTVQTKNKFESLRLNPESPFFDDDRHSCLEVKAVDIDEPGKLDSSATSWQNEKYNPDRSNWVSIEQKQRDPMEMIPAFDSEFWDEFGNTLRVFGTQEAVLKIAEWEKQVPEI
ncbi:CAF1-domain-containing protein [Massarina eburnea CBS 473.64]|uniref:CAF1-domain-containing protein n=1 Tax=Massarina eburnea CBS 473.64 TaxID=1395130 RepID=A0A6A6RHY1_9PLEO|nr:CAF1-domain-containing protein [Massarina eburnea CBS 473.64]